MVLKRNFRNAGTAGGSRHGPRTEASKKLDKGGSRGRLACIGQIVGARSLALRARASAAPALRPAALRRGGGASRGQRGHECSVDCELRATPKWTLRATVAPASRQMRAAARSRGPPLARRTPDRGHAARWQLPAATARRSQGQGQAKPAEEQHTEERRAEGQLRRDRSGGEDSRGHEGPTASPT